jgi:hypothetical protein
MEDDIKMDLTAVGLGHVLNSSVSGGWPVLGCRERSKESLGSVEDGKFLV